MQAVYFIALFSLVLAVISSFTVGISANSMQVKEGRLEQVQQTFDNLEFAINNVVLKERPSLSGVGNLLPSLGSSATKLSESELKNFLPYMRNASTDLINDPWNMPINYYALEFPSYFCDNTADADSSCTVWAPVAYFVMVSAGPNRTFESGHDNAGGKPNSDTLAFLNYPTNKSDDIVRVFSTDGPMRAHYNNMVAVQDRVIALVLKSYRDQSAAFFGSEQVTTHIRLKLNEALGDAGFFGDPTLPGPGGVGTDPVGGGCTDDCLPFDITAEDIYGDILQMSEARGWDFYPKMKGNSNRLTPGGSEVDIEPSAYGAEGEMQFDPFCAIENGNNSGCIPFKILYDDDRPWEVILERKMGLDETGGWLIEITQKVNGMEDL